jgi:hypothetical protein
MHALPETNATGAPPPVKQFGFLKSLGLLTVWPSG